MAIISYTLKKSRRAKYMRLTVRPGGIVVLTAPESLSSVAIEKFIAQYSDWAGRAIEKMRFRKALPSGKGEYRARREAARTLVHARLSYWNSFYSLNYNRVAIKDTKSLWGSCSRKGNLNFSYKIIHLPQELQDYIIVHELCHLKEPNHSRAFWALVAKTQPNFLGLRRELRRYIL